MALRRANTKRLFDKTREPSPIITMEHSPISSPSILQTLILPNPAKMTFHRQFITSADSADVGFFRRFLQRRRINQATATRLPEFLSVPVGDKLRQKLISLNNFGDHLRLDGLSRPVPATLPGNSVPGVSVDDARKILRTWQLEKLRSRLRQIPRSSISYSDFVQICADTCSDQGRGAEFAKTLDQCGNVIVLGNVVFLRPDQMARSMEKLVCENMAIPNDPRKRELEEMVKKKAVIDRKAESLVRAELYCGLGFLVLQTLGFMRLTFWELSWDVMEPICFFVTSLHFALAYAFFLRTSKEPSFEGYFQRRFRAKQKKLMKIHDFDIEKYSKLCEAFYPGYYDPSNTRHFQASEGAGGARRAVFAPMHS